LARFDFLRDPAWRRATLHDGFGRGFFGFLGAAALTGVVCWAVMGREVFVDALWGDVSLLTNVMPRVFIAISIAALVWFLIPRDRISALVGSESGMRGLIIATIAGTITPGGPASAYALLAVLAASGADRGALVAYITAWATLGLQRVLVWDVPFMGAEFAFLRILISLPLPVIAGLIARRLPMTLVVTETRS
jgi:uncharacterized membrane protein YraQ (UPF0718 family)